LKISRAENSDLLKSVRVRWRESDKATWSPSVWWLHGGEREAYERNSKKMRTKDFYNQNNKTGVRTALPNMQVPFYLYLHPSDCYISISTCVFIFISMFPTVATRIISHVLA
jgi:hypothetical protein